MSCRTMVLMRYAMSDNNTQEKKSCDEKTFKQTLQSLFKKFKEFKLF